MSGVSYLQSNWKGDDNLKLGSTFQGDEESESLNKKRKTFKCLSNEIFRRRLQSKKQKELNVKERRINAFPQIIIQLYFGYSSNIANVNLEVADLKYIHFTLFRMLVVVNTVLGELSLVEVDFTETLPAKVKSIL